MGQHTKGLNTMADAVGSIQYGDYAARRMSRRFGGWVATTAALTAIGAASRHDGMVVGAGANLYYYDDDAGSGDYRPDDLPATGWWKIIGGTATAASNVLVTDSGNYYTATNVETILAEVGPMITGRVQTKTATITHADLTDAVNGEAQAVNIGTALPTNARILAIDIYLTTQFTGGSASAVKMDIGVSGETTALFNQFDVYGSTAAKYYSTATAAGTRIRGNFSAKQLIATFTPDGSHTLDGLTAGSVSITADYYVPA